VFVNAVERQSRLNSGQAELFGFRTPQGFLNSNARKRKPNLQ
jgi:hypothetical protein